MDCYLGQVQLFAYMFVPRCWAPCNGQILQIQHHEALFSLLGTMYGGDGIHTFALPKLDPIGDVNYYVCVEGQYPPRS
jgi:microcystin-dependent protein